jgi:hypothetical protein
MANTDVAGALQAEIWTSLGFNPASAGYNFTGVMSEVATAFNWSSATIPPLVPGTAVEEMPLWGPENNYNLGNPAQPQFYIPSTFNTPLTIPEPATLIVWSLLGASSWLGMRVWRQGRRVGRRQPWSNENRTAILEIIGRR